MSRVAELLREALRLSGRRFVSATDLPHELVEELASLTYEHVAAGAVGGEPDGGWLVSTRAIATWWRQEARLTKEEGYRLHKFRSDVVHRLEQLGVIRRENPQSRRLYVRADPEPHLPTPGNPDWTWEEDVLALDLFMASGATEGGPLPSKDHEDVVALSELLRALPVHPATLRGDSFRNPAGVAAKLGNFRAVERDVWLDCMVPGAAELPRGLESYSAMDRAVYEHYFDRDFRDLSADAARIAETADEFEDEAAAPAASDRPVEDAATVTYEVGGTGPAVRTRGEHSLVQRYREWMAGRGVQVVSRLYRVPGSAWPILCDAYVRERNVLIEAKGSASRGAMRMAIGQLMDYRRFEDAGTELAVLVPYEPPADMRSLLGSGGVGWIWPLRNGEFRDSVRGRYTR